jgi:hypothetical protein
LKEAMHELGHTFGLGHCADPACVMWFSNNPRGDRPQRGHLLPPLRGDAPLSAPSALKAHPRLHLASCLLQRGRRRVSLSGHASALMA